MPSTPSNTNTSVIRRCQQRLVIYQRSKNPTSWIEESSVDKKRLLHPLQKAEQLAWVQQVAGEVSQLEMVTQVSAMGMDMEAIGDTRLAAAIHRMLMVRIATKIASQHGAETSGQIPGYHHDHLLWTTLAMDPEPQTVEGLITQTAIDLDPVIMTVPRSPEVEQVQPAPGGLMSTHIYPAMVQIVVEEMIARGMIGPEMIDGDVMTEMTDDMIEKEIEIDLTTMIAAEVDIPGVEVEVQLEIATETVSVTGTH